MKKKQGGKENVYQRKILGELYRSEMCDEDEIMEMAEICEELRKELYE